MPLKSIVIGLTGGIGSGKTYVGKAFRKLGAKLIEADKIAHKIITYPQIKIKLLEWYGFDILKKDKGINCKKVAELSFVDFKSIRRLNKLTHPYIKKEIFRQLKLLNNNYRLKKTLVVVIDAPLLIETNLDKICDYVVFIKTCYKIRRKRIFASRKWNGAELRRRGKYQVSLREKQSKSHFIINNNKPPEITMLQTQKIFQTIITKYA